MLVYIPSRIEDSSLFDEATYTTADKRQFKIDTCIFIILYWMFFSNIGNSNSFQDVYCISFNGLILFFLLTTPEYIVWMIQK